MELPNAPSPEGAGYRHGGGGDWVGPSALVGFYVAFSQGVALGVALALANASGRLRLGRAWGYALVLAGLAGLSIGAVVVDARHGP